MKGRLERDLEEVLARVGDLPPPHRRRRGWRLRLPLPRLGEALSLTPGRLAAAGLLLLLTGLVLLPYVRPFSRWMAVAGLALLVASYVLYLRRMGGRAQLRWRGRPVDYRPRRDDGPLGKRRR